VIIKKYVAQDLKEAMRKAKEELGSNAIILQTRHIKRGGILGIFRSPQVEVTVAVDDTLQVNSDRLRQDMFSGSADPKGYGSTGKISEKERMSAYWQKDVLEELQKMKSIITDVKSKICEIESIKGMSEHAQSFYKRLVNNNVDAEIAREIVNNVELRLPESKNSNEDWAEDVCLYTLQEYMSEVRPIKIGGRKKGNLVFVVGPTGVGKTTTIAKLAANMTFAEGKSVALITLDTYRVSAAQQLRTFAEIIGIPISVVFNCADLKESIRHYRDKDIIFVDTAGRSPYNEENMEELRQFIEAARPDETILVLSVTTDSSDLVSIFKRFDDIGVDKVIFTKLDEARHYGQILNVIYEIRKPIAYFTDGQNVPDDIKIPDPRYLAELVLGKGEKYCEGSGR